MNILETLLQTAYQDTQSLKVNNEKGDDFSVTRNIEFVLKTDEKDKAETVTKFINDHRYGEANLEQTGEKYRISVIVNMPSSQHIVCSVSALMTCIATLFTVDYDGWVCAIQTT